MQSRLIRLIEVVFSNGTVLSVSDKSESFKQMHPYRSTKNEILYYVCSPEVQMN